jgi:hypothetical protein
MTLPQAARTKASATRSGRLFLLELSGDPIHPMNPDGSDAGSVYSADLDGKKERNFLYAQGNLTASPMPKSNKGSDKTDKGMEIQMATPTAQKPWVPKQHPPPNSDFYRFARP